MIEQRLARMAAELVGAGVRRLIVAGGETSGAVVDRLGIRAFVDGRLVLSASERRIKGGTS